ncbi:hypothetical protein MN210_03615 [Psychrobacter raelei]|uniref:Uncharacterized protein n=1 Tax=Psychrobacter raelei TaxID=2565531 RepID=A0AAT9PGB6_9GAMM|nr:hypothetical protein [Psychrobacter sp. PraFG1]UNK05878.1 hypothetical protein MN210_03615 [Psychrobacter sp. PraFG1]
MSSMGNSQDDAQQGSSASNKPNLNSSRSNSQDSQPHPFIQISRLSDKLHQPFQQDRHLRDSNTNHVRSDEMQVSNAHTSHTGTQAHSESSALDCTDLSESLSDCESKTDTEVEAYNQMAHTLQQRQIKHAGIRHPSFNGDAIGLDPDRPLSDIPHPAPRYQQALHQLVERTQIPHQLSESQREGSNASMWALIASPELASHLELLQLGGLINLPAHFFEPVFDTASGSEQSDHLESANVSDTQLLAPLTQMSLLDMADIYQACQQYPGLTRYGFRRSHCNDDQTWAGQADKQNHGVCSSKLSALMPEMINDLFAPSWEVILYPERFDNGVDSLTTDILACSVAVHILKQCRRQAHINEYLTAKQICQHMRSYVLSQCNLHPQFAKQYRQIRLFEGHVVVAASYLSLQVQHAKQHSKTAITNQKGETSHNLGQPIYLNLCSDCVLFTRYPNISNYYINGWS